MKSKKNLMMHPRKYSSYRKSRRCIKGASVTIANLATAKESANQANDLSQQVIALRTDLEMAKERLSDEPMRIEEAVRLRTETLQKQIGQKDVEIVKLSAELDLKEAAVKRDEQEIERNAQQRIEAEKKKIEEKYKILIREKLNQLGEAQKDARKANEEAKQREDQLRKKVNERLEQNARDHISIKQHEEVLKSRLSALRVELTNKQRALAVRQETDLNARMKDKGRELEGNFRAAEGRMQQQILDLQNELDEERQKCEDMEMRSREDRQVMIEHRTNVEGEKKKNVVLTQHLEEASLNIGNLKQMVRQARDQEVKLNENILNLQAKYDEQKIQNDELSKQLETKIQEHDDIAEKIMVSESNTQMLARSTMQEGVKSLLMTLHMVSKFSSKGKDKTAQQSLAQNEIAKLTSNLNVDEAYNTENSTRFGLTRRVAQGVRIDAAR